MCRKFQDTSFYTSLVKFIPILFFLMQLINRSVFLISIFRLFIASVEKCS